MSKLRGDQWYNNPPRITSHFSYPFLALASLRPPSTITYRSPPCGFGWRFEFIKRYDYELSASRPADRRLVGRLDIIFKPSVCHGMALNDVSIRVKVTRQESQGDTTIIKKRFSPVTMKNESHNIGTYEEPDNHDCSTSFEITVIFDPNDQFSIPTTSLPITSTDVKKTLISSLSQPVFIDMKMYLYSAKVNGRPAVPKPVFANTRLVFESCSPSFKLLSPMNRQEGISCCLEDDVPEAIEKLQSDVYDYDSDSDLDPLDDADETSLKDSEMQSATISDDEDRKSHPNGKAFAINNVALRTWKAFVYYIYTNEIHFKPLKSAEIHPSSDSNLPYCSPKSMYRLADYMDLSSLKNTAQEAIKEHLHKSNIVAELFSSFTHKYRELIELEVDFLIDNISPQVSTDMDQMLKRVVAGGKPSSFKVLAFTMRRLCGQSVEQARSVLADDLTSYSDFGFSSDEDVEVDERGKKRDWSSDLDAEDDDDGEMSISEY